MPPQSKKPRRGRCLLCNRLRHKKFLERISTASVEYACKDHIGCAMAERNITREQAEAEYAAAVRAELKRIVRKLGKNN